MLRASTPTENVASYVQLAVSESVPMQVCETEQVMTAGNSVVSTLTKSPKKKTVKKNVSLDNNTWAAAIYGKKNVSKQHHFLVPS